IRGIPKFDPEETLPDNQRKTPRRAADHRHGDGPADGTTDDAPPRRLGSIDPGLLVGLGFVVRGEARHGCLPSRERCIASSETPCGTPPQEPGIAFVRNAASASIRQLTAALLSGSAQSCPPRPAGPHMLATSPRLRQPLGIDLGTTNSV